MTNNVIHRILLKKNQLVIPGFIQRKLLITETNNYIITESGKKIKIG